MELVERYLNAIKTWLPAKQRQDILAELSEDLHSQIEERQATLGRTLRADELEALLKERGRPMLVANRYQAQERSLIGPVFFPTYLLVLKVVALCYLLPWFGVFVIVRRAQQPLSSWIDTLQAAGSSAWTTAFVAVGVVTLIFAILEAYQRKTSFLEQWSPSALPKVRDSLKVSPADAIAEVVVTFIFLLVWLGAMSSGGAYHGITVSFTLAPVSVYFIWGFLLVTVFNLGFAMYSLTHPYWTRLRASLRLLSDLSGSALFCLLLRSDFLATLTVANVGPERSLVLKNAVHSCIVQSFPWAVIFGAVILGRNVYRFVQLETMRPLLRQPGSQSVV